MFDVRCPTPADDLLVLWPEPVLRRCNREQMLIVVQDSQPVAGCILWDGGHALVFVGDFRVVKKDGQAFVAKTLLAGLLDWCRDRGRSGVLFHASSIPFAAALLRLGAQFQGQHALLTLGVE